jgi:hypothetical protein
MDARTTLPAYYTLQSLIVQLASCPQVLENYMGESDCQKSDINVVPIDNKDHLAELCNKPTVANKFIIVSWIGNNLVNMCKYKHHVLSLTPMVITSFRTPYPARVTDHVEPNMGTNHVHQEIGPGQ